VQAVDVLFGIYGHAGQLGIPAGPDDADRDLAAIRDEDLPHGDLSSSSVFLAGVLARSVVCTDSNYGPRRPISHGEILTNRVITLRFIPITWKTF
jgi:hypothetical protein